MEKKPLLEPEHIEILTEEAEESEFFRVLKTLQAEVLEKFAKNDYKSAAVYLKKSEELLEAIMTQGGEVHHAEVLVTLHNLAFCYQKLGDLVKSAAYLEACIYNINTFRVFSNDCSAGHYKLRQKVYLAKVHLQLCAVMSELQNHKQALVEARKAVNYSVSMMKLTLKAGAVYSSTFTKLKKQKKAVPNVSSHIFSIVSLANPALKSISHFMKHGKLLETHRIPSVLGVKSHSDWVESLSLTDMLLLQNLHLEDLSNSFSLQSELTKDFLIMKICIFATSFFCLSTELQYMRTEHEEAKKLHEKALTLLSGFIPSSTPLLKYFQEAYHKRFPMPTIVIFK